MKERQPLSYILAAACVMLVCVLVISAACGRNDARASADISQTADPVDPIPSTQESEAPPADPDGTQPSGHESSTPDSPPPEPTSIPGNDPAVYRTKYPDLYVSRPAQRIPAGEKLVYLTFDDGPSKHTQEILRILDEKGAKATFFVVYKQDPHAQEMYREIVRRGHTLAIHTASHKYQEIYQSVESYLDDFYKIWTYLYEVTGVKCTMFRFPGGSNNAFSKDIHDALEEEMLRRGFTYWDWNVDSKDTARKPTRQSVTEHTLRTMNVKNRSVILMHDTGAKGYTVEALGDIIQELKNREYRFDRLEDTMKPVTFDHP